MTTTSRRPLTFPEGTMNGSTTSSEYAPGKQLYFPHTGSTYVITAVDEDTVTFALPFDLEDATTETIAALESVDAQVQPEPVDDFTTGILTRCQSALQNHGGHPNPAWSHGEQMIVALVLNDDTFLADVGTTVDLARQRLHGDLCWLSGRAWSADDLNEWITTIHTAATAGE